VEIRNQLGILRTGNKLRNRVHGAGTVQGNDGRNILHIVGLQTHAHAGHPGRLHLKYADGLPLPQHFIGLGIVLRNVLQTESRPLRLHHFHRVVQYRQVPQAQKVHFEKAQLLQRGHDVLADNRVVVFRKGDVFVYGPLRNHHARRVGGGVAGHPLQLFRRINENFHVVVALVQVAEGL